jgi:hypothetical protein
MIDSQKTLWFNGDRTRFFLVPNDQELPSGDFILRRGVSHQMQVDELALPPYEVTREAARAYLDSQAEQVLDQAKSSVLNFLEQFKLPAPPPDPSPPDPAILEKLATGIEQITEAIADQLRTKAENLRGESESTDENDSNDQ